MLLVPQTARAEEQAQASAAYVTMYRLYNPNSGEHLYTKDTNEVSVLSKIGWIREGEAWKAATSGDPVYRLYNPNNGDHHYTLDLNEYNTLERIGWRKEGIAWYSDKNKGVPVYRLFNPYQTGPGSHHYTTDKNEYEVLKTKKWNQEGIAWYGVNVSNSSNTTTTTPKAKYSYELYTTVSTIYSGYKVPIFIKTDNPTAFIEHHGSYWLTCDGPTVTYGGDDFVDVQYSDSFMSSSRKVEGGFLEVISFDNPGTYTLSIVENISGEAADRVYGIAKVSVTVLDGEKYADEWQNSVINKVTTSKMNSFEKMDAVCNYLLSEFKYSKNNGMKTLNFITDSGIPYFVSNEWDREISPAVLCEFAEKIGGFDNIRSCYRDNSDDYQYWKDNCYYVELTIGKETRRFHACPPMSTNGVSNISQINLIKSNLLRKL